MAATQEILDKLIVVARFFQLLEGEEDIKAQVAASTIPKIFPLEEINTFYACWNIIDDLLTYGLLDTTLPYCEKLLTMDLSNTRSLNVASIFSRLGRKYGEFNPDFALKCYKKAIGLAPNDNNILFGFGLFYQKNGDNEKALEYLQKSNDIKPSDLIHKCIGNSLLDLNRPEEAIPYLEKVHAYERLGDAHLLLGNREQANEYFYNRARLLKLPLRMRFSKEEFSPKQFLEKSIEENYHKAALNYKLRDKKYEYFLKVAENLERQAPEGSDFSLARQRFKDAVDLVARCQEGSSPQTGCFFD